VSNAIQRSYFEDDIVNATPQRLRLMLIEGAMRFVKRAITLWETDHPAAVTALGRSRNIIIEIIASIRGDRDSCAYIVDNIVRDQPLNKAERQTEIDNLEAIGRSSLAIYLIVFRQIDEAQLSVNCEKLSAALEILDVERETAQMLCEQLPEAPQLKAPRHSAEITSSQAAAILKKEPSAASTSAGPATYGSNTGHPTASFSFEA
jgi:flagellar secretion chaperone FliS